MNKNKIIVDLGIWDFDDISHHEITQLLGIEPVKLHVKGEKINPKFLPLAQKNGWIMTCLYEDHISFDIKINSLLDIIESKFELFKMLSNKYYCEISCALYINFNNEQSTPSIHLDNRYYKIIKELKIEFDLDIILIA